MPFHFTAPELALAVPCGVIFGGVVTGSFGWLAQRTNVKKDARLAAEQRLWTKRAELYPRLLAILVADYSLLAAACVDADLPVQTYLYEKLAPLDEMAGEIAAFAGEECNILFEDYRQSMYAAWDAQSDTNVRTQLGDENKLKKMQQMISANHILAIALRSELQGSR